MNILVIGGSFFFGKKIVELLLQCNHNVTVMTRGNNEISNSQVEHLICDCTDLLNLKRVTEGRTWDVILHQVCFDENAARVFSKIFHGKAKRVIVTSSILVYSKMNACEKDFDEKNHEITKCIVKDYSEKKKGCRKDYFYGV
jgi:nucleoside-diphosphate-sugar epimerase